jgi:hypothetical protein
MGLLRATIAKDMLWSVLLLMITENGMYKIAIMSMKTDSLRPTSKAYITSLQSRIQLLERLLEKANGTPPPPPSGLEVEQATPKAIPAKPRPRKGAKAPKAKVSRTEAVSAISSDDSNNERRPNAAVSTASNLPRRKSVLAVRSGSEDDSVGIAVKPTPGNEVRETKDAVHVQIQKSQRELASIMANVMAFINEDPVSINPNIFVEMASYDAELDYWYSNLPKALKWRVKNTSEVTSGFFMLQ